jgi:hypothetical protein
MTKKAIYFLVHESDETLTTRVSCDPRDDFQWNTAETKRIEKRKRWGQLLAFFFEFAEYTRDKWSEFTLSDSYLYPIRDLV